MSSRNPLPLQSFGLCAALATLAPLTGCLPGLSVTPIQTASGKPANVAVYFKVETNDGKPVSDLNAGQFTIFEDGTRLAAAESKQAILSPKLAAAHDTLLLIDVSGTTIASKEVGDVIKASSVFTDQVQHVANVAVYTFDGTPDLNAVVPFATPDAASAAEKGTAFKPRDPKASFDGAIIVAMKILGATLAADPKVHKLGTLVVFTDGTNKGTLSSAADLRAALAAPENAKLDIFAVGLGAGVDATHLEEIGRSGTVTEAEPSNMAKAFEEVAAKVSAAGGRYYVLSYCSLSRGGSHEARIEAHAHDGLIGDMTTTFSADGFGPGCDPSTPSGFDAAHPPEPPPVDKKKEAPKKPVKKPQATPQPAQPPASDPFEP